MANNTGISSFEDLAKQYRDAMEQYFGVSFNTSNSSNNFKLQYPILNELLVRYNKLENWLNARNVYTAEGIDLDDLLGNFNFSRKQPSKAIVDISTADSTPTTVVNIGDLQVQDSESRVFENMTAGTVDGGGNLILTMQSLETGEGQNINASTLTDIVTPVSGINTVTNSLAATGGQDVETDSEYRIRFLQAGNTNEFWTLAAIEANILKVSGVVTAKVYENDTTTTDSIGIPPKAILCVVQGGVAADIAQAIYEKTNHAIFIYGDILEVIQDVRGEDINVRFSRPDEIPIEYDITIDPVSFDTTDIETQIELYINESTVNENLSEYKAIKDYINPNIDTAAINDLQIGFRRQSVGGSYFSTLQMDETEKAVI